MRFADKVLGHVEEFGEIPDFDDPVPEGGVPCSPGDQVFDCPAIRAAFVFSANVHFCIGVVESPCFTVSKLVREVYALFF